MVMCGKDMNVCNHAVEREFRNIGSLDKTLVGYDEVDHYIWQDGEYMPLAVKDICDWMSSKA